MKYIETFLATEDQPKENMGFWTDSNAVFDYAKYTYISVDTFEDVWHNFLKRNGSIEI